MKTIITTLCLLSLAGYAWSEGCLIDSVTPNTPAERAGLKAGDVIVAANGTVIRRHEDLVDVVRDAKAAVPMSVRRAERTEDITVDLSTKSVSGPQLGVQCLYSEESSSPFRTAHALSVGGGGVFPVGTLDTGEIGAGDQSIGSNGYLFGAQYLYNSGPTTDFGLEVGHAKRGKNEFDMYPFKGGMSLNSTEVLVIARYHAPRKNVTPYFLAGIGLHITDFTWEATPMPVIVWTSGDPADTRNIISETKTGLALALGFGVDYDFNARYFAALEARLDLLSRNDFDATPVGNSIGLKGAQVSGTYAGVIFRVGTRFGQADAAPAAKPAAADGMM